MKTMFAAALVFGLCGLAGAREDKANPVGTWKCEYDVGGQKRTATLKIKKDGDKLAGTMIFQDKQESKLMKVNMKDSELSFTAEREIMDNKFVIDYKLKVDGDKMKGKGSLEIGGEKREFDIEAKREK